MRIKDILNRRVLFYIVFFYLIIQFFLGDKYGAAFYPEIIKTYYPLFYFVLLPLWFLGLIIWDYHQQKFKEGLKMVVIISVLSIVGLLVFFSVGALA